MALLKPGSKGPDVEQLQLRLKAAGYDPGDVDGDYGPKTAAAVRALQASQGLAIDGEAGPATIAAIAAALSPGAPAPLPVASPTAARHALKRGDQGPDVEQLQLRLKAAGYDPGPIDGDYGARTAAAVTAFQADRPDLDDDGVAGPMTIGALDAAVARKAPDKPASPSSSPVPCDAATWSKLQRLVAAITGQPVRYGPGRGLWHGGKFLVTYGAGKIGGTVREWPNVLGRPYPSLHCTSFCNLFLGWLLRRNQDFTHAGNIPPLFDLLEKDGGLHQIPGGGAYRGYGDACSRIAPDGSGAARARVAKVLDAREIYERRASLPTFVVWAQSTRRKDGTFNWWHHTGLFVVDHRDGDRLYRWAADGSKDRATGRYSADPMRWTEVTGGNLGRYAACVYRAYGVDTVDGTYGDPSRPIADVDFEVP